MNKTTNNLLILGMTALSAGALWWSALSVGRNIKETEGELVEELGPRFKREYETRSYAAAFQAIAKDMADEIGMYLIVHKNQVAPEIINRACDDVAGHWEIKGGMVDTSTILPEPMAFSRVVADDLKAKAPYFAADAQELKQFLEVYRTTRPFQFVKKGRTNETQIQNCVQVYRNLIGQTTDAASGAGWSYRIERRDNEFLRVVPGVENTYQKLSGAIKLSQQMPAPYVIGASERVKN